MSIGGGGGGGPVGVSNSFTGIAESLEIIGTHCYAYSGQQLVDNNEADLLSFRTGNFYAVVNIQFNYPSAQADDFLYSTYLNDTKVQSYMVDHAKYYGYQNSFVRIVIPPYTEVRCTASNEGSTTERPIICSLAGRIYR